MKFRLYVGLERGQKWFNYAEVQPVKGGGLAVLDSPDKSGAARFLSLLENSCFSLFTSDGEEYELKKQDYSDIKLVDAWRISIEAMKTITGKEKFIIPENFYCSVCSQMGQERYTQVEESWQDLIEEGLIDETYQETSDSTYITELPVGFEIFDKKTQTSRQFNKLVRQPITIGDTSSKGYIEKWIVYGRINGQEVFSAKELTVFSGKQVTIKDNGAYGFITVQGHGRINDIDFESPVMIRYGDITKDEFFVPYQTALKGVTIENTGCEPLVLLKFFGPDCNPDMPDKEGL